MTPLLAPPFATRERIMPQSLTRFSRNVVPGVHRLQHAFVNSYLLEDQSGITIVDAAFPETWTYLLRALDYLRRSADDVRAVVLTHAHFDHLGFAARAQHEWRVPVFAHAEEEYLAAHPYRYLHERSRLGYPVRHPGAIPVLTRMARTGALRVPGVTGVRPIGQGDVLDLPGQPRAVFSPGHTFGHCAFHLAEKDALLSGDALVTFDPYTGASGPQIVSGAATADSAIALESLSELEKTGAQTVLPGHGQPWREGITEAVRLALAAGRS